MKIMHRKQH